MHNLLVNNGSSINVLAYDTYHKMGYLDKNLKVAYNELYGFTWNLLQIVGHVNLHVTLGVEP